MSNITMPKTSQLILDRLAPSKFIKYRIVTSKKLLIIRSNVPQDAYTMFFSFLAGQKVKEKAVAEGWTVTDLQANDTNRANVEKTIRDFKPDFIMHFDHGTQYALYGQDNGNIVAVLDAANTNLLEGKAVSTVSCESALGLGPLAVDSYAKAYLGYDDLHWVNLWYTNDFIEASNAANYALLEGKTFQEAYDIAIQKYNEKYDAIITVDQVAAGLMLQDRDRLRIVGDATAKATGIAAIRGTVSPLAKTLKGRIQ
ncbi:MAG: hypothetical protein ACFCUE_12155 [Candidatus Bathyarchaeia archaeon]|jgi:hypothetical protein